VDEINTFMNQSSPNTTTSWQPRPQHMSLWGPFIPKPQHLVSYLEGIVEGG
jgi:hypothetical protein